MKIITNLVAIAAILGLLSTLICGFWIKSQPTVESSSISFHVSLGTLSVGMTIVALLLLLFKQP